MPARLRTPSVLAAALSALAIGVAAGAPVLTPAAAEPPPEPRPSSLYDGPGPRPGPDILYAPPPRAPQLENAPGSGWRAQPIMVSGASAYRHGEFLHQDYLFDDLGSTGAFTYPTDPRYAGNAADLVELRARVDPQALVVRLTYNAMVDAGLVATTLALGSSPEPVAMPHGAGAKTLAALFVTVQGDDVRVVDAASGAQLPDSGVTARVDLERRQVQVIVPDGVLDTRSLDVLRLSAASGLWDAATSTYLRPAAGTATATRPGGGTTTAPAFFNVVPRHRDTGRWNSASQAAALTTGDLSRFGAELDLPLMRRGGDDAMLGEPAGTPASGDMHRIYPSHFEDAQGRGPQPGTSYCRQPCWNRPPDHASQLQPYRVYVPVKPAPPTGYGFTLNLHYCGGNHNEGPPNAAALGERGTGHIVVTPLARIPCSWYWSQAGADSFEAWADIARTYRLDPALSAISGWSMGGYGVYKFVAQFPDLFARALPDIGCTSAETNWLGGPTQSTSGPDAEIRHVVASYRHVPFLSTNGSAEAYCMTSAQAEVQQEFERLGYRYDWRYYSGPHGPMYPTAAEAAAFLGNERVDVDPAHVTYVYNAGMDEPEWGMGSDHAYWISGLSLQNPTASPAVGTVDVVSHGFGRGDAPSTGPTPTAGTSGTYAYAGTRRTWGTAPATPVRDRLDITATGIRTLTVHAPRARVTCGAQLDVTTDGPLRVVLSGCPGPDRVVDVPAGGGDVPATVARGQLPLVRLD